MKPTPTRTSPRRRGFTLVELLVAMALIIFIMVILTEAFSAGIGTFRVLKAQGDMQEKLRSAGSLLRDDLRQPHFDNPVLLSNFDTTGKVPSKTIGAGYFFIQEPGVADEGSDAFGHSYRMVASTAALCFTINHSASGYNQPQDYFVGRLGNPTSPALAGHEPLLLTQGPVDYQQGNCIISPWAEVGYFLVQTPNSFTADGTTPLFSLRRRVRVIVPDTPAPNLTTPLTTALNSDNIAANDANQLWGRRYAEVSCVSGANQTLRFNKPTSVARSINRQSMRLSVGVPLGGTNSLGQTEGDATWFGDDIVLTDVISFNVRALYAGTTDFDTSTTATSFNTVGATQNIMALEITIRVWDSRTQLSRQMTIIQDM